MKQKSRQPDIIGIIIMTAIFAAYFSLCIFVLSGCSASRKAANAEYELKEREMTVYKKTSSDTSTDAAKLEAAESAGREFQSVALLLDKPEITIAPPADTTGKARPTVTLKANSASVNIGKRTMRAERSVTGSLARASSRDTLSEAKQEKGLECQRTESTKENSKTSVPTAIVLILVFLSALWLIYMDIRHNSKKER